MGQPKTEEQKKKISEGMKRKWAERRAKADADLIELAKATNAFLQDHPDWFSTTEAQEE